MTLAEALVERKDLIKSIGELQKRYVECAMQESGEGADVPEYDPTDVLLSLEQKLYRLEQINIAINLANNQAIVSVSYGETPCILTLMKAIARREYLKQYVSVYEKILETLRNRNSERHIGYRIASAPKMVLAAGVSMHNLEVCKNKAAKELRQLELSIQAVNVNWHLPQQA